MLSSGAGRPKVAPWGAGRATALVVTAPGAGGALVLVITLLGTGGAAEVPAIAASTRISRTGNRSGYWLGHKYSFQRDFL